jgi:hypothetical protein
MVFADIHVWLIEVILDVVRLAIDSNWFKNRVEILVVFRAAIERVYAVLINL